MHFPTLHFREILAHPFSFLRGPVPVGAPVMLQSSEFLPLLEHRGPAPQAYNAAHFSPQVFSAPPAEFPMAPVSRLGAKGASRDPQEESAGNVSSSFLSLSSSFKTYHITESLYYRWALFKEIVFLRSCRVRPSPFLDQVRSASTPNAGPRQNLPRVCDHLMGRESPISVGPSRVFLGSNKLSIPDNSGHFLDNSSQDRDSAASLFALSPPDSISRARKSK